jgi:acetylornithine deacetylase
MHTEEILARLVSFPTVVGRPNGEIADWIRAYAESVGATVSLIPGPEGDRTNLLATLGPADAPGIVLSGHMDVVPASEADWTTDPFALRREGNRLYGRGTTDMKGFLACALAALPALAAGRLARPIHLALSYDEEAGCRGVPHLIAALPSLCAHPVACIVGEPSGLRAVRAHKGKAAARVTVRGRTGHSSRPDRGLNAIHAMSKVLAAAVQRGVSLTAGPFDLEVEPPYSSLQVGRITGGEAVNIIPDLCNLEVEARAIAGVAPAGILAPVQEALLAASAEGYETSWEMLSEYPALSLSADAPLTALMRELTGEEPLAAVSYGTEAGLYQAAGIEAIICGPGDIARAHRANEYIETDELGSCRKLIETLGARLRC